MPSYDVSVDGETNRLYLTLEGHMDDEMAASAVADIEAAVEDLRPGFAVVNDISEFKPLSQDATEHIERGQQVVAAAGAGAVVRVTGESVIGKMQFDRIEREAVDYHAATAESVADAERLLDEQWDG